MGASFPVVVPVGQHMRTAIVFSYLGHAGRQRREFSSYVGGLTLLSKIDWHFGSVLRLKENLRPMRKCPSCSSRE